MKANKISDYKDYKDLFIKTASSYLSDLKRGLEHLASDNRDQETIKKMHLSSHNIKSESLLMNFPQTANTCYLIEDIFYKIIKNQLNISKELIFLLNQVFLKLDKSLISIKNENKEADFSEEIEKLKQITV